MTERPLTVAWFSYFPVEWLSDVPESVQRLPRLHPATWQRVLLAELEKDPTLRLHIIVLRKSFERDLCFERNGVTFHLLKTIGGLRAPTLFLTDTWRLRKKLAEIKPDLVHAWGTENGAALVASRLPYPYLVTMQGIMTWIAEVTRMGLYQRLMVPLEKQALQRTQLITAESTFAMRYLKRKFPHLTIRQAEHAPAWTFHRVRRTLRQSPLRFIFVGAFTSSKGADMLLESLAALSREKDFELIVVGHANKQFLEPLRASLPSDFLSRIQFKPNLTSDQVAQELAAATIMIYPTRVDNSPNAVKEAVVAGVPVVASAVGGIVDYVFNGRNGILFEPKSAAECLAAIRTACEHPLFQRGEVDPATLAEVRNMLSPAEMGRRFREAYQLVYREKIGRRRS
jgi:glycosyltransferase involved in cell wall biosynthesis